MRFQSTLLGFSLIGVAVAGVVPQPADHPEVKNPAAEDWQYLKNIPHRKDPSEKDRNSVSESKGHSRHHTSPAHHHGPSKNQSSPHDHNQSWEALDIRTNESPAIPLHGREIQPTKKQQSKSSTTAVSHKISSSKAQSSTHIPAITPELSYKGQIHKTSSSNAKSISAATPKSSAATGHKSSTIKPGISNQGKGTKDVLSGQTSKGNIVPDSDLIGPQSKEFIRGPYGPTFTVDNTDSSGHIGDKIDPVQQKLWVQQGITNTRGLPPGSKFQLPTKRDAQVCSPDGESDYECQVSDNSSIDRNELPSEEIHDTSKIPPQHSLWSRFTSLVRRTTIGAQSSVTGIIPQKSQPVVIQQSMVFNGQPGMIWLKEKGNITYCGTDDYHTILGDYKVYLPSIFFYDTHNSKRCNEPCFLFWVSANGPKVADRFELGNPNFVRVVVAGQCNDCYPWEVQAEGAIISLIASNMTVDWNQGLWGPTLALGTNENFYNGTSDL